MPDREQDSNTSSKNEKDPRVEIRDGIDPEAVRAAVEGDVPPPAEGAAGESAPDEPSRAEIFAVRPELADSAAGTPTEGHGHDREGDAPPDRRKTASH